MIKNLDKMSFKEKISYSGILDVLKQNYNKLYSYYEKNEFIPTESSIFLKMLKEMDES